MKYALWRSQVEKLLQELKAIDFGYPLGNNLLRDPLPSNKVTDNIESVGMSVNKGLCQFYCECNGLSWPDVHNGYFITSCESLCWPKDQYDPIQIQGPKRSSIITIGSTGTGALLAIGKTDQDVLLLPPGRIENNTYFDPEGAVRVVASGFNGFAIGLLEDLRAFVNNDSGHTYLA